MQEVTKNVSRANNSTLPSRIADETGEIWKDIPGYEGLYQVSNLGRVKSFPRFGTVNNERILKLHLSKYGYISACLCRENQKALKRVNRLVAFAFIPNENNLLEVNHIDGNKLNNYVENLEWVTNSENKIHAYKTGLLSRKGVKNCCAKLNEEKAQQIRELCKNGISQRIIAKHFGVSKQTVSDIKNNKLWKQD
jgi:DNA-binding XRE family transcriptional regulator